MNINASIDLLCMGCMAIREADGVCTHCGFDEESYISAPHHLPLRTILNGKYLIGRVLGEGGFGITYLGWDLNLDLQIAVKEFYPTGFVTRENTTTNTVTPFTGEKEQFFQTGRNKFVEEAKRLAKFYALPGIVSVKDFFLENGTAYIVMEYVEGETLKQRLANAGGKLPALQVFEMMKPLMGSLSEIHNVGIIHRDISPDNIMITKGGIIKLLDFGAARDFSGSGNRSLSVMLKPGYAPEEQYRTRGKQGPWTDVYSLCATMYKAITGITPDESSERMRNDEVKRPSQLGIAITAQQENALMRGMEVLQENRMQSVEELSVELYEGMEEEITIPLPKPTPQPEPPKPTPPAQDWITSFKSFINRNKKWIGAVCAALVIIIVVLANGIGKSHNSVQVINSSSRESESVSSSDLPSESSSSVQSAATNSVAAQSSTVQTTAIPSSTVQSAAAQSKSSSSTTGSAINKRGNSAGNIMNLGSVAQQGDWIYYSSNDGNKLYKIKKDGSGRIKLNDDKSWFINVVDDWVYYCGKDLQLYKIKVDGSGKTKLNDDTSSYINVVGDWVYYSNESAGKNLYKIKTDGTGRTKLSDDICCDINVVGDCVYYLNDSEYRKLYKIKTDGTGKTKLNDDQIDKLNVVGDWMYYTDGYELYKMKTDGTGKTKLNDDQIEELNAVGGWMYYTNFNDDDKIYKIKTDGTGRTKLNDDTSSYINVIDDWVYYYKSNKEYRIKIDGTERQEVK